MYNLFLISLGALLLSACTLKFTPPVNGPKAELAEDDSSIASVAVFDDPLECKNPRPLYLPFAQGKHKFVAIPAQKPLTIRVITYGDSGGQPLFDNLTFIPETNTKYLVKSKKDRKTHAYHVALLKESITKKGTLSYIPVHALKRTGDFIKECTDNEMKEVLSTMASYQNE